MRLSLSVGVGAAIAAYLEPLPRGGEVFFAIVGGPAIVAVIGGWALWVAEFVRAIMPLPARSRYAGLAVVLVVCGGVLAVFVTLMSPKPLWATVADVLPTVPPAVFLLVAGVCACRLVHRSAWSGRYRWAPYGVDVLVVALATLETHLLLDDRDMLTTQAAAGLLFPIGAWLIVRAWRMMASSRRAAVRAGADIVLSLLLGTALVLLLVWLANLADLSLADIAMLRAVLDRTGSLADLPWQLWVGLYLQLAALSLHFAVFPALGQRFRGVPMVGSLNAGRRVLTGVHIGLMVTVLIAVSTPAAVETTLRGPLKVTYTVALQRELECRGERAAYDEIRQRFTGHTGSPPPVQPLISIVEEVHLIRPPSSAGHDARLTDDERDLARRLGQLQAAALRLPAAPPTPIARHDDLARFDSPVQDTHDLNDRLRRLDAQQRRSEAEDRHREQAAELATIAVANLIQIPGVDGSEVVQIVKEYLSGLVENSPLKGIFAAWAAHLTAEPPPTPADIIVVPDPRRLKRAASEAITRQQARLDPSDPRASPAWISSVESDVAVAVDLTDQARILEEINDRCGDCHHSVTPREEHDRGPGEHPVVRGRGGR